MADVSKINVNGTAYNVKDATARTDIQTILNRLNGDHTYVFIGDSYGEGSGAGIGWINKLTTKLGLTEGTTLFKSSIGGAGFTKSDTTYNFVNMLTTLGNSLTAAQRNSVTRVVCIGGTNDVGVTTETIAGKVTEFCTQSRSLFPNAEVYIGMGSGCYANNFIGVQSSRILPGYMSVQNHRHCHYLHNLQYALHERALMGSDHIHPTSDGYDVLADAIIAALDGGFSYSQNKRGLTLTPVDGTFDNTVNYTVTTTNDITVLSIPTGMLWRPTSAINWGFNVSVKIGTTNANFIGADSAYSPYTNSLGIITTTAHWAQGQFDTDANVWFDSAGGLWVRNTDVYHTGVTGGYANITAIRVAAFSIACPTIAC